MAIALLTPLPTPPLATDTEAVFNSKTDVTLLAEKAFVDEMNSSTIPGINQAVSDANAARDAAADSAEAAAESAASAANQKSLAVTARQGAETARNEAQAFAQAAGSGIAPPPLPGKFLGADENGNVDWRDAGQSIGDTLITSKTAAPPGYLLPNTVYSKALYPELSAIVGALGANLDLNNFTSAATGWDAGLNVVACVAGKDGVAIAVGTNGGGDSSTNSLAKITTDYGSSWANIPALTGVDSLSDIATDGSDTWLVTGINGKVWRSTNNGVDWVLVGSNPRGLNMQGRVVTDGAGTWACYHLSDVSYPGIAVSINGGSTWTLYTDGWGAVLSVTTNGTYWFRVINNFSILDMSDSLSGLVWRRVFNQPVGLFVDTPRHAAGVSAVMLGNHLYVSTDKGLTWKLSNAGNGVLGWIVTPDGVIIARYNGVDASGLRKILVSYDYGETFSEHSISGLMNVPNFSSASRVLAMISDGTTLTVASNGSAVYRSLRQYNYDTAAQFKTPTVRAPRNLKAYIKGKAA